MTMALYLYGLVPWAYHDALEALDANIKLLKYADLAAVYRQYPRNELTSFEAESDQQGISRQLLEKISLHDAITQKAIAVSPFFPTGFATFYSNKATLREFMAANHQTIAAFLRSSAGHREWAIKGYITRQQARDHLLAEALRQQSNSVNSAGQNYVKQRQLALKIDNQLTQWLQDRAESAMDHLSQWAAEVIKRPLPASAQTGEGEECFGSWAFLLADEHIDAFAQVLNNLNSKESVCGLRFGCTGPWALYSFSQHVAIEN